MRKTQREQVQSGMPQQPDLHGTGRHFAHGPEAEDGK